MAHIFEEHTGEAWLRLRTDSLPALYEEAARALAELMCAQCRDPSGESVHVEVRAPDRKVLLAAWIDELVYLSEAHRRVWTEVRVHDLTKTELRATVRGCQPEALRTQVKAATLHDLRLVETSTGSFEATVALDV